MKVFERLVKNYICSAIPDTLDPLQFAYRPNRSTDDAISHILHSSLMHIDSKNGNYTLRNKGTKAVTGAVPFQKVHVCT